MDYAERYQRMKQMRDDGMTCKEIGEQVGLSAHRVGQILCDRPKHWSYMKEPKHQPAPLLSVADVLKIADKVSEETGRYPSYGKVVAAIENGSIDPWRYIRRKRRLF